MAWWDVTCYQTGLVPWTVIFHDHSDHCWHFTCNCEGIVFPVSADVLCCPGRAPCSLSLSLWLSWHYSILPSLPQETNSPSNSALNYFSPYQLCTVGAVRRTGWCVCLVCRNPSDHLTLTTNDNRENLWVSSKSYFVVGWAILPYDRGIIHVLL